EGRNTIQALMENFLDPVFRTTSENLARTGFVKVAPEEHVPWGAYVQAWVIALTGGGLAFFLYMRFFPARRGQPLPAALEGLRTLSWNKFYVDELYQLVVIRPVSMTARALWRVVDSVLIDGVAVRGTAWVTKQSGSVLRYLQTGDAQAYAAIMALGLAGALVWILQRYAL
ncbi:MAG: NADH-quinone oxidoreductase subunit L, partial [Myxococcaceae bacterium]|nr:NADH-quinone oxidoreductase subunit L [Myxococcaceae bacterium]